jgi:uncharacterized cupin superfamily protein
MADVTIKKVSEVGYYTGPNAVPGIKFRYAGKDLGVTAWGMNVVELAANVTDYPEHDHSTDGQEEVYAVLSGSGTLESQGKRWSVEAGTLVRVAPAAKRKFVAGPSGLTLLAIGGTPGKAYAS